MTKFINPNILNEGNQMELIQDNENPMKRIVRCNNCGKPTEYGETRMICGFVGCDNTIIINSRKTQCYFGDLMPRVMKYKEKQSKEYKTGKVYRWRDNADGGFKNEPVQKL